MALIDYFSIEVLYGPKKEVKRSLFFYYLGYIPLLGKTEWLKKVMENLNHEQVIIKNRLGKFFIYTFNDIFHSSYLFEYQARDWLKLDKEKKIFLDVGANIGFYTIFANKLGFNQIISFEPNLEVFKILEKNLKLNDILNADLNNIGLDCKPRNLPFYKYHNKPGLCKFLSEDELKNYDERNIMVLKTISFDKYASDKKLNFKNISFIKIDVEGFEYNVLKGMEKTLKNLSLKTKIFVEISDKNPNNIIDLLKAQGFKLLSKISNNYLFEKNSNLLNHVD